MAKKKTTCKSKTTKSAQTSPKTANPKNSPQKPNSKIAKADELRKIANQGDATLDKTIKEWKKQLQQAKNTKEREAINDKYDAKVGALEAKSDKAYTEYYNYVHGNFDEKSINEAGAKSGHFMDKSFINKLEKNSQTSLKTTSKPSDAKSYTVRQGRTSKTFKTKSEAQTCASQSNHKATITKTNKKPTHKIVKFTARV
ncbi:MAG: hypothetical protein ACI4MS_06520 [Candidatus Coproplasma sp.]